MSDFFVWSSVPSCQERAWWGTWRSMFTSSHFALTFGLVILSHRIYEKLFTSPDIWWVWPNHYCKCFPCSSSCSSNSSGPKSCCEGFKFLLWTNLVFGSLLTCFINGLTHLILYSCFRYNICTWQILQLQIMQQSNSLSTLYIGSFLHLITGLFVRTYRLSYFCYSTAISLCMCLLMGIYGNNHSCAWVII